MSVLDDLKKEAEKLQQAQQSEKQQATDLEKLYEAKFRARMVGIAKYLHQLVNQLKEARMEIPVVYMLPEIGPMELKQKGYVISADSMDKPRRIGLQMDCVGDSVGEWQVSPIEAANRVNEFLEANGIEFSEWSVRDSARRITGRVFKMQVKVRVWFMIEVDLKREKFRVKVIHYDFEGERTMYFKPSDITKEWLNDFAKFVLRKEKTIGVQEVDAFDKDLIKTQMEEAEMERKLEIELAERKKEGLVGKLMETLNKPIF